MAMAIDSQFDLSVADYPVWLPRNRRKIMNNKFLVVVCLLFYEKICLLFS